MYPEPFFVWHKRIQLVGREQFPVRESETSHEQDQDNGDTLDSMKENASDDSNEVSDVLVDEMKERIGEIKTIVNRIAAGGDGGDIPRNNTGGDSISNPSADDSASATATCTICGYTWNPRKPPEEIRKCPKCNSRNWNDRSSKEEKRSHHTEGENDDDDSVKRLGRFLEGIQKR